MRYLTLLVFTTGAVTLGVELSAARLLDPWFGNSQVVWAALIGLVLFYLAVGAWLGGRLADRYPTLDSLHGVITLAGLGVALIPWISPPVLRLAALGLEGFVPGLLLGALIAILALFSLPVILLGTVSPWAVRLAVTDLDQTGRTAGRLYAVATAGSIAGTFLPVLWLIPTYGTRWTFYLFALGLLLVVAVGSARRPGRWRPVLALLAVSMLAWLTQPGTIRAPWGDTGRGTLLYEDESQYNYIAVYQWGSERHLKLNEGMGIHSVYHPDSRLSLGIWDYFLLPPLFNPPQSLGPPSTSGRRPLDSALILGLAAGTASGLLSEAYGSIPITGVELDPQIIEVGRRYFEMDQPNLTAVAADGRRWLSQQAACGCWDLIVVDAYRPPYIPFHLTTREFFELVRQHLSERGVVAINVGRTPDNYALVDALAATLAQVFPSVYAIDEPGPAATLANTLLVATVLHTRLDFLGRNAAALPDSMPEVYRRFALTAVGQARTADPPPGTPVFSDDRAPVEQVVHGVMWDFLLRSTTLTAAQASPD